MLVAGTKLLLAATGIALVAWQRRADAARKKLSRLACAALCVTALAGLWGYHSQPRVGWVGYWDLYHYYLGSKYFDELGYYDLYGATLVADRTDARMFVDIGKVRDIRTQGYVSADSVVEDGARYTDGFSEARWAEFRRDVAWFQGRVDPATWRHILRDRGYHPSPTWDRIGGWLTNAVPLEAPGSILLLVLPDQLLFLFACVALWRAYGLRALALFLVAWGANPLHLMPLKGALLRLDWLVALLLSCAAVKRKRYALAGAGLAYASMVRVFPVVFLGAWLLRVGWDIAEHRRVRTRDLRLAGAFVAVAAGLFIIGCIAGDGSLDMGRWTAFAEKMELHRNVVSVQRSGLEYLVGLERPLLYWPCVAILVAALALAARTMHRDQLIPAGMVLMFALVSAPSYYFVVASIVVLFFHRLRRRVDVMGQAALMLAYALAAVASLLAGRPIGAELSFLWSLLLLGLTVLIVMSTPLAVGQGSRLVEHQE